MVHVYQWKNSCFLLPKYYKILHFRDVISIQYLDTVLQYFCSMSESDTGLFLPLKSCIRCRCKFRNVSYSSFNFKPKMFLVYSTNEYILRGVYAVTCHKNKNVGITTLNYETASQTSFHLTFYVSAVLIYRYIFLNYIMKNDFRRIYWLHLHPFLPSVDHHCQCNAFPHLCCKLAYRCGY